MIRSAQRCCLAAAVLLVASSLIADEKKLPAPLASSIDESIELGIAFLVADQNENGSWGSARQTKGLNIYAPVPGAHNAFRAAVTAMAISALIESGLADDPESPAGQALQRGSAFLMEELPTVRRASADAIYNVWTHAFGIQALVDLYPRASTQEQKAIVELINNQIYRLGRYESVDGGWGYYDFRIGTVKPSSSSISFTTATCLVAFHEAKDIPGVEIPEKLLARASEQALQSAGNIRRTDEQHRVLREVARQFPDTDAGNEAGHLAREQVMALCDLVSGVRAVDGGAIANARIVESISALLIGMSRRYRVSGGVGVRFTGLPNAAS